METWLVNNLKTANPALDIEFSEVPNPLNPLFVKIFSHYYFLCGEQIIMRGRPKLTKCFQLACETTSIEIQAQNLATAIMAQPFAPKK